MGSGTIRNTQDADKVKVESLGIVVFSSPREVLKADRAVWWHEMGLIIKAHRKGLFAGRLPDGTRWWIERVKKEGE